MGARLYANGLTTKLTAQLLAAGTSASITSGDGASWAAANGTDWYVGVLRRMSGFKQLYFEIVKVSNRSTDTLTIVRAQESTTAKQFEEGDILEVDFTAASLNEAWTAFSSTPTAGSGAFTTIALTGAYQQTGKSVRGRATISITTAGSAGSWIDFVLPVTAAGNFAVTAIESGSKITLTGYNYSSTHVALTKYDGTFRGSNGDLVVISFQYEAA